MSVSPSPSPFPGIPRIRTGRGSGPRSIRGTRRPFGYADPDNDIEIVNVRLVSIGGVDKPALDFGPRGGGDPLVERRSVWFGGWRDTPVLDRERLAAGSRFEGPAIVEEAGGTPVAPPGWTVEVDPSGALRCEGTVHW